MILAERRHVGLDRVERWRHDRVSALSRPLFRGPRLANLRPNLSQRRRITPEYTTVSGWADNEYICCNLGGSSSHSTLNSTAPDVGAGVQEIILLFSSPRTYNNQRAPMLASHSRHPRRNETSPCSSMYCLWCWAHCSLISSTSSSYNRGATLSGICLARQVGVFSKIT